MEDRMSKVKALIEKVLKEGYGPVEEQDFAERFLLDNIVYYIRNYQGNNKGLSIEPYSIEGASVRCKFENHNRFGDGDDIWEIFPIAEAINDGAAVIRDDRGRDITRKAMSSIEDMLFGDDYDDEY